RGGSRVSLEQYGGTRGCFGEHANVCRRSAHPSFGVSEAKLQTPGAENVPRERDGLFDIVRWVETRCCPHPEERACASASAKSNARARISKDEDDHGMAQTHRSARRQRKHLRSRRAAPQHEGRRGAF